MYITQSEMKLVKDGEAISVFLDAQKITQIPSHNIEGIVIFGYASVSPQLLKLCSEKNIHVSFISYSGRFLVKLQNPCHGNVRLRKQQYILSDSNDSLYIAKNFVLGKIYNSRCVLQRLLRDHHDKVDFIKIESAIKSLKITMSRIDRAKSSDSLRGIEGEAAKTYYQNFNELILDQSEQLYFNGRSRRPPKDEINCLLSFFYTLLSHECSAALETVGLDSQVGFYHKIRPGRSSLALDMMEELRPYLVDRFVVTLINNRRVKQSDFIWKENGACLFKEESRKTFIKIWQERKQEVVLHPFLKERIEIGLIPYSQALLLARFVRGDLDAYPPFLMR